MEALNYAIEMEKQNRDLLRLFEGSAHQELVCLISILTKHQDAIIEILANAAGSASKPLAVGNAASLFDDTLWRQSVARISENPKSLVSQAGVFWMIYALYDKSFQYYQQASQNSPMPTDKYFLTSLAEIRRVTKLRIDTVIRVLSNEVWGQIGFAPFVLGKE